MPDTVEPAPKRTRSLYLPRFFRRVYQGYFLLFFFATLALMTDAGIRRFPTRLLLQLDPLSALAVLGSSWLLPAGLAVTLVIVALTLGFGRAFCGWICPVGTLHQLASWSTRKLRRGGYQKVNRWRPHFRIKYLLLFALLIAALGGSAVVGLLDPLSLLTRSFASGILPALSAVVPGEGTRPRTFAGAWLTGGIFLGLLAANRWIARWWCRALCPLGALLGLGARAAVFRIHVDPDLCNHCHRCARDCQGADEPFAAHRVSECHVCLNCVSVCPEDAISYRAFAPTAAPAGGVDLPRRQLIGAALAGAAVFPLLRATSAEASPEAIRPPGALPEDAFLARCVRCGACVNACPTSALQPSLTIAGLEGLYTPVLVARHGWCEPSCTRCGEVCPTGAIAALTPETKGWVQGGSQASGGDAREDRHGLLRLGPLPALGDGDAVCRVRGGLPHEPEGDHARAAGRGARRWQDAARGQAEARPGPLRRLRAVRGQVPGRRAGRDPDHACRRVAPPADQLHARKDLVKLLGYGLVAALAGAPATFAPEPAASGGTRPPALAGSWYPDGRARLASAAHLLMRLAAPAALQIRPLALVVPHAGWSYSGPVAGTAFHLLKPGDFERVVVLGPSHHQAFRGYALDDARTYRTPAGEIPLCDGAFAALQGAEARALPAAVAPEHSVEIELPFLQAALGRFCLVPILVGETSAEQERAFATRLAQARRRAHALRLLLGLLALRPALRLPAARAALAWDLRQGARARRARRHAARRRRRVRLPPLPAPRRGTRSAAATAFRPCWSCWRSSRPRPRR